MVKQITIDSLPSVGMTLFLFQLNQNRFSHRHIPIVTPNMKLMPACGK